MKKTLALLALAATAFAQTPPPSPEAQLESFKKVTPVLVEQRNLLSAQLLDVQAQLVLLAREIEDLKKQLADAKAKQAAPESKPETKN